MRTKFTFSLLLIFLSACSSTTDTLVVGGVAGAGIGAGVGALVGHASTATATAGIASVVHAAPVMSIGETIGIGALIGAPVGMLACYTVKVAYDSATHDSRESQIERQQREIFENSRRLQKIRDQLTHEERAYDDRRNYR